MYIVIYLQSLHSAITELILHVNLTCYLMTTRLPPKLHCTQNSALFYCHPVVTWPILPASDWPIPGLLGLSGIVMYLLGSDCLWLPLMDYRLFRDLWSTNLSVRSLKIMSFGHGKFLFQPICPRPSTELPICLYIFGDCTLPFHSTIFARFSWKQCFCVVGCLKRFSCTSSVLMDGTRYSPCVHLSRPPSVHGTEWLMLLLTDCPTCWRMVGWIIY